MRRMASCCVELCGEQSLPVGDGNMIERGDTLQVTGSESSVQKLPLLAQ
jgi:hypothetical protein